MLEFDGFQFIHVMVAGLEVLSPRKGQLYEKQISIGGFGT